MEENQKNKKIYIKLGFVLLSLIVLIIINSLNNNGMDTLKPWIIITIAVITFLSTCITFFLVIKNHPTQEIKVSYQINDFLFMVVIAVVLVKFTFTFLFFPAQVQQTSMYPTLQNNQMVISRADNHVERFDIVVVYVDDVLAQKTNNELKKGEFIVKRVIGLPGEKIYYQNGNLYVNGNLIKEDFLEDNMITQDFDDYKNNEIPDGEVLILGDHRHGSKINNEYKPGSFDGRAFGTISEDTIIGKVVIKRNGFFNWEKVK